MRRPTLLLLVCLAGCTTITPLGGGSSGGEDSTPEEDGSTSILDPTSSDESGPGATSVASTEGSTSTGASSSEDGSTSSASADGTVFLATTGDTGCAALPPGTLGHCSWCSIWQQDCPDAEACKPWANDGGSEWNSTRCSPIDPEPAHLGETCVVEGSSASGIDSCAIGSMCWNVDAQTDTGECVAFCQGSPANPTCDGVATCLIANDGQLALCLPACDPLDPSCDDGEGCYPGSGADFVCLREGDAVVTDLPHTACAPGSLALDEDTCAAFCDLSAKAPCEAGLTCTPYFEGEPPKAYANVGVCL